jgi:hypothetical protein
MMPVFLYLLLAHFLIDWCWQGPFIAENKHKMWQIMFAHCAAWSLGIGAVLAYFGLFTWWKLAMLFIGHWIEDLWKAKKVANYPEYDFGFGYEGSKSFYDKKKKRYFGFLLNLDQGFHFIQLGICLLL